jgi:hypothetical protein
MKEYCIKVWDTFFENFEYENYDACLQWYSRDEAIEKAKEFAKEIYNDWTGDEVGVYVRTLTLGAVQQIGYIDSDLSFVEMF